jgi:hypothetical protein
MFLLCGNAMIAKAQANSLSILERIANDRLILLRCSTSLRVSSLDSFSLMITGVSQSLFRKTYGSPGGSCLSSIGEVSGLTSCSRS